MTGVATYHNICCSIITGVVTRYKTNKILKIKQEWKNMLIRLLPFGKILKNMDFKQDLSCIFHISFS